jgi:glycosyltransferase involved in cell wall biosynthesis
MKTLSICIPSINRKKYLLEGLRSILDDSRCLERLEICISNNASDEDYTDVEDYLANYPMVKYLRQSHRISLDENMHACVKAATGEYVYYLGDDDFFFPSGVDKLLDIIDREEPDLVVLNGINVDAQGIPLSRCFSTRPIVIRDISEAFSYFNEKCAYGALLVKRRYLPQELYKKFYGTSHAYTCFWGALVKRWEADPNFGFKALTPKDAIVAIRRAKKTYSSYVLDVHFDHMPRWYITFLSCIAEGDFKQRIRDVVEERLKLGGTLMFLARLKLDGQDVRRVKTYSGRWRSIGVDVKLALVIATPVAILRAFNSLKRKISRRQEVRL